MNEYLGVLISLLNFVVAVLCEIPVVTIRSEAECTTYVLVHNMLQIEWFAREILNCTVHVETIKALSEYEYLCIKPKQLYFPNCVAKASVYEGSFTNLVMTRNCYNRLDPTFCTVGSRPLVIKFEAYQKSNAHVVFRVEGKNGQYSSDIDDEDSSGGNEGLITQIVLSIAVIAIFFSILTCIIVSCRRSGYSRCDSSSERSSPRTIQTEDGESNRPASVPELNNLIQVSNKQTDLNRNPPEPRETPPPPYKWDNKDTTDSAVKL